MNSTLPVQFEQLSWPASRLGEAMEWLARTSGLPVTKTELPGGLPRAEEPEVLNRWIDAAASVLGLEAEPVESACNEVESLVKSGAPALLQIKTGGEPRFLAVIRGGAKAVTLLNPALGQHRIPSEAVRAALCQEMEAPLVPGITRLLEEARIPARRRPAAAGAMLRQQLAGMRVGNCWLLRLPPGASLWRQAREARVPSRLLGLLAAHTAQYLLWLLSWWMIGKAALQGRFDWGWLAAWALILFGMVPFGMLVTWSQGLLSLRLGAMLKRLLLFGALQLQPDAIRHKGAGQLLGCVLESEAVESLALSGGFLALMAGIELTLAAAVMALGPGGALAVALLALWVAVALAIGWHYSRKRQWWTQSRLALTNDLVERMVGHRTRLAQQRPERWHEGEDNAVSGLQGLAVGMDRSALWLGALVPRGWLLLGLGTLAPAFILTNAAPADLAVGIGGVLLAFRALQRFAGGVANIAGAVIAWKQVAPLFEAATRTVADSDRSAAGWGTIGEDYTVRTNQACASPKAAALSSRLAAPGDGRTPKAVSDCAQPEPPRLGDASRASSPVPLLEAHDLNFSYRARGVPVLRDCGLMIRSGDRVLLEGPSGGGKSTLASVLARQRAPDSGLLLLHGLDRQTVGLTTWRRQVASAPQFHENHVLTGTLAFNLLMGRRWPPREEDFREAEVLCSELGLGELLRRMPAGLLQLVGESGWQLSHGEKSRLYIARALLQKAELVILDESFGALDPDSLRLALKCVLERASTLLVIAHP